MSKPTAPTSPDRKIYVAGHRGIVGSAIVRQLRARGHRNIVAKISGIKMGETNNLQYGESHGTNYRGVMSTNLYGPGDNYHPTNSHVVAALIRRFHEAGEAGAPSVQIRGTGTGTPRRVCLYVDDMASACLHVMELDRSEYTAQTTPQQGHINVGYGSDPSIAELAALVKATVGYEGDIRFDTSKPDGGPRKLMDSTLLCVPGWRTQVELLQGLELAYREFLTEVAA